MNDDPNDVMKLQNPLPRGTPLFSSLTQSLIPQLENAK